MNIALVIYLLDVLDDVGRMADIALFISIVVIAVSIAFYALEKSSWGENENLIAATQKGIKYGIITAITAATLILVIPSKNTIAAMYVVPKIVNNEAIQEISGNSLEVLRELTKKWLYDIREMPNETKKEL